MVARAWHQLGRRRGRAAVLGLSMAITVGAAASLPLVEAMASESALVQTTSAAELTVLKPAVGSARGWVPGWSPSLTSRPPDRLRS